MNIWRPTEKNSFSEINRLSQGLSKQASHSAIQKMVIIFNNLFQSYNQSLLSNLYQEAFKLTNKEWKKNFICAVNIFSPESEFGKAIVQHRDFKIDIDNLDYSSQFESYLRKSELTNYDISRREEYSFKIPLLECFFANLALSVMALRDQQRKADKWEAAFYQDQFFYYFSRNPLLVIIKDWLARTKNNYDVYTRVLKILELIFLKDLTAQLRRKERVGIRYTTLYAIYVISERRVSPYHFDALEAISQNLQKRSNNANLLTLWVRLNLGLLLNVTVPEDEARQDMRQFDMTNIRFSSLSRKYFQGIDAFKQESFQTVEVKAFFNFLFRVEALLDKNFWEISPLFLQMIFIMIALTEKFIAKKEDRAVKILFLKNIFKKGTIGLKNKQHIDTFKKIQKQYQLTIDQSIEDFDQDQSESELHKREEQTSRIRAEKSQREIRHRKSLKVYQGDPSKISPWKRPILNSESFLLYEGTRWVSRQVDRCRRMPKEDSSDYSPEFPKTDLRFLASPKNFILLLVVFILPIYWLRM